MLRTLLCTALWLACSLPMTAGAQEASELQDALVVESESSADLTEEIGTSVTPLPVIFYSPETKLAFGGAVTILYRPEGSTALDRPSTFTPAFIFTTRSQVLFFLGGTHFWSKSRNQLTPGISYRKFPDSFYGIGNDTNADDDEDYTDEGWVIYADYLREFVSRVRAGLGVDFAGSSITGTQPTDMLQEQPIPGQYGANVVGVGPLLAWDSRDNISFPRHGQYHQFSMRIHDDAWGSEFDFTLSSLDLRTYFPLGSNSALALRAKSENAAGTCPFQFLPGLGGDQLLRGYYAGRFRDQFLLAFQGELRLRIWKRLGAVAFGATGQVAPEPSGIGMDRFHSSFGVGLRILLVSDEGLNLRCDYGVGEDSTGLYFSLGEAF